jgi:hypothetical protein
MEKESFEFNNYILTTETVTGLQKSLNHDSAVLDDNHLKICHKFHILRQSS